MILLDTNALIWLDTGHRRAKPLLDPAGPLRVSPASLRELQFLEESGRIHLDLAAVVADDRWKIDDRRRFSGCSGRARSAGRAIRSIA